MTVIRPNSISGITSLTAHRGSIDFYAHDGSAATFNNINSNVTSGVSTFASLNITGDLDVGGALTYEDVTNIDSVGVITARNGIDVTGGSVGIGTDNPQEDLHIGSNSPYILLDDYDNSRKWKLKGTAWFAIEDTTAGADRLRINSTGYVGINDTNPDTQLSVNSGATNVVAKFASTDQYAWIQFRDNSTTDTAVMVGADGDNLLLRSGSNERVRVTSSGTVKFATNNSSTDYLEWGSNPRLTLKTPTGLNGLRIYGDTTPFEVGTDVSSRKISIGGGPAHHISISADYSLSSGGYDSSPKVFLNATRHDGSSTVTSFQTSIQAVAASNTAGDGYLGLGASATPDDLVIRPSGKIGLDGMTNPVAKLHIGTEDDAALTAQTVFVEGAKTGYANYTGLPQNQLCLYDNTASTAGSGGAISFGANCGGSQQTWIAAIESQRDSSTNDASNYAGSIVFWTRPAQSTPTEKLRITSGGLVGIATAVPSYRLDIGDGVTDPANGNQLRVNAAGDYIFALQKQSNASFSIRNNSTGIVHLNTQNSKILSLGVSSGNASGSIEDDVRIDSNGHLTIQDGDLVIGTSGHGISFSATSHASGMSSELLDDYEEGTYTPTLTNNGSSPTYQYQQGRYTKIGRYVIAQGIIGVTNNNSLSGSVSISIPFTGSSAITYGQCGPVADGTGFGGVSNQFGTMVGANATAGTLVVVANNAALINYSDLANVWYIRFNFMYEAA